MKTTEQLREEERLLSAVEQAKGRYQTAKMRFERSIALCRDLAFALGGKGAVFQQAEAAYEEWRHAFQEYRLALCAFNDFVLRYKMPDGNTRAASA